MKKILFIGTTADNRNRLDGETVKCRLLRDYLSAINNIKLISVDTDNWQKHVIKLVFLIIYNFFKCDTIIISSADRGAHIVLDFFRKIRCKKDVYYFVIGGSLYENISGKNWNVNTYSRLNHIYVEADIMKKKLSKLNLDNVSVLNNFRKVGKFKINYKSSKIVRFVYFGRVIKEKGIEESIKLVKRLNNDGIACIFDIYGQCEQDYLKEISSLFDEHINYYGEIIPDSVTEYETLSQYDIFLFPTYYPSEGLPGSLIDAYISGLAVIASNWKYAREHILDGENGVIFEYKNYDDMYDKTVSFVKSGKLLSFKSKSLELAKKYNIEELLKEFLKKISCSDEK